MKQEKVSFSEETYWQLNDFFHGFFFQGQVAAGNGSDDSGSIISLVLFAVAAAIAFAVTPIYHYMQKWAIVCLVMGIISVLMIMWKNSRKEG